MLVNKIIEMTIYESPDGGRTVYARKSSERERTLHSQDSKLKEEQEELHQQQRWQFILAERKNNSAINELCEQIEILYELSKK